jgi:hypothetical protein
MLMEPNSFFFQFVGNTCFNFTRPATDSVVTQLKYSKMACKQKRRK